MIEFTDSFSQAAVAQALCTHPDLVQMLSHQLALPSFAYAYDMEGQRIGGPLIVPNPVLCKTWLFVSPRNMREALPTEINFVRFRCDCDAAGQPIGDWQRTIVGAYINHGSNEDPDWSSHT